MQVGSDLVPAGPAISVVVSTLGNYETLRRVLQGFAHQSADPASFEVIVATDAADPEPERVDELVERSGIRVASRVTGAEPGLSSNRNAGIAAARSGIVLFTDNDTIPCHRLVAEHLGWHERNNEPETGVLGRVRWSPEIEVTTFMKWLDTGVQFDFANIKTVDAGWGRFVGANVSVKRSLIDRVGPFDQRHFPYGYEDTDWAYRASKLGFRLLYNKRAIVDHLRPMSLEFWQRRARRVAVAERAFCDLHPELQPWFHNLFSSAARAPRSKGRGIPLAPFVPRWVPWLGPRVWASVDLAFKQAIAPYFLAAWEDAAGADQPRGPDLSEFKDEELPTSPPGGPK